MRRDLTGAKVLLLCILMGCFASRVKASNYDDLVMSHFPVGYWMLIKGYQSDASGHGMTGAYFGGGRGEALLPNGETASIFNGIDNYFQVPDNDYLEITRTGILTIEAWMRPDVEDFPDTEGDGYVHWMGKGTTSNQLWVARMYNKSNATRPQRISGYCFNLSGGLGTGSYFQDVIATGTWVHYVLVINTVNTSAGYPTGYTKIYRDGVQRDMDRLDDYSVVPGNGNAPMRVATRDLASFFKGAIGKVALYDYELSSAQIASHNSSMREAVPLAAQFDFVKASVVEDELRVRWKTEGKPGSDRYQIQISKDGHTFKTIETIQSATGLDRDYERRIPFNRAVAVFGIVSFVCLLGVTKMNRKMRVCYALIALIYIMAACSKHSDVGAIVEKERVLFVRIVLVDDDGRQHISKTVIASRE